MVEGVLQGDGIIARGDDDRDQRTHNFLSGVKTSF
jgi:hypothetical protein